MVNFAEWGSHRRAEQLGRLPKDDKDALIVVAREHLEGVVHPLHLDEAIGWLADCLEVAMLKWTAEMHAAIREEIKNRGLTPAPIKKQ